VTQVRFTFTVHELVDELDRQADTILRQELEMTYGQFRHLASIGDGCSSLSELASRMGTTRAATSKRAPDLAARGWIRVAKEGRDHAVSLTPKGARLLTAASDLLESEFRDLFRECDCDFDAMSIDLLDVLTTLRSSPWA
jgi:DNA-binding MarR family transcriptional regulator